MDKTKKYLVNKYDRVMPRVYNRSSSSFKSTSFVTRHQTQTSTGLGGKPSVSHASSTVFSDLPIVLNDYKCDEKPTKRPFIVKPRRTLKSLDPALSPPRSVRRSQELRPRSCGMRARGSAPSVLARGHDTWPEAHIRQCLSSRSHTKLKELKDEIKAYQETEKLMRLRSQLYKSCGVVLDDMGQVAEDKAVQVELATEKVVRKKWKGMRDYFFRQVKELEKNGIDYAKNNSVTILWPLFDSLKFLIGSKTNTNNNYKDYKLTDEEREMIEEVTEYDKKQRLLLSFLKRAPNDTVSPDSTPKNSPVQEADELNQSHMPPLKVIYATSNTLQEKDIPDITNKRKQSEPPPLRIFMQGTNALKTQNQAPPTKKLKSIPGNDLESQTITTDTETDADLHFFKSLLPFMRALPLEDKLRVRNGIQDLILGELEAIRVKDSVSMTTQYHDDDGSDQDSYLNPQLTVKKETQLNTSVIVKEEINDKQYLEIELNAENYSSEDDNNSSSI